MTGPGFDHVAAAAGDDISGDGAVNPRTSTEWRITGERWWVLQLLLACGIAVALPVTLHWLTEMRVVSMAPMLGLIAVTRTVIQLRTRVRLTVEGVVVRRLRTKTYPWHTIDTVQVGPAWKAERYGSEFVGACPAPAQNCFRCLVKRSVHATTRLFQRPQP